MIDSGDLLARRLARYRSAIHGPLAVSPGPAAPAGGIPTTRELADRLAAAIGGEVRTSSRGAVVWCQSPPRRIPVDRDRLSRLPGQPPPGTRLVCLDTETTGLATAAGTVAFLVGLGWWEGDLFHQVQLLVPDHADEPAMLDALAKLVPADAWLVTYNGRAFDWPLLVARYRLHGSAAPVHAGHLDLLPVVRRLFRHRMDDARLRTAERHLLGIRRHGDVDGWEIPGRYLAFLHGGSADPLAEVVRHNDQDVRSLAHLLVHLERGLGDRTMWERSHPGDLAGLARSFARQGNLADALECLDIASELPAPPPPVTARPSSEPPWWAPGGRPDFGARIRDRERPPRADAGGPWTTVRIAIERARLQRRAGDAAAAARSWRHLMDEPGRTGIVAAIELAKLHEHQFGDVVGALRAATTGLGRADWRRRMGHPEPALERDLRRRVARLERRSRRATVSPVATGSRPRQPSGVPSRA